MKPFVVGSISLVIVLSVFLIGCRQQPSTAKPSDVDYYTCTMHPSVKSQDPDGKCPICHMDLVPVLKKGATQNAAGNDEKPGEFVVPLQRQQLIGVTYGAIEKLHLTNTVHASGIIAGGDPNQKNAIDSSQLFVWAQFYQDDLPILKKGSSVIITTSALPGESFKGNISAFDPAVNEFLQTERVRIDVQNFDSRLRPGGYVNVEYSADMGKSVAVRSDAILPTGRHNIAFVDKGEGKLEPRFVELGRKCGDFYQVISGLKEDERVVTSANFLIDAEANVQGALKSW